METLNKSLRLLNRKNRKTVVGKRQFNNQKFPRKLSLLRQNRNSIDKIRSQPNTILQQWQQQNIPKLNITPMNNIVLFTKPQLNSSELWNQFKYLENNINNNNNNTFTTTCFVELSKLITLMKIISFEEPSSVLYQILLNNMCELWLCYHNHNHNHNLSSFSSIVDFEIKCWKNLKSFFNNNLQSLPSNHLPLSTFLKWSKTDSNYISTDNIFITAFKKLTEKIFMSPYNMHYLNVCCHPKIIDDLEILRNSILNDNYTNNFTSLIPPTITPPSTFPLLFNLEPYWHPTNPSIVYFKDCWWVTIRFVNYEFRGAHHTHIHDNFNGKSVTKNILLRYKLINSAYFFPISQQELIWDPKKTGHTVLMDDYQGIEDIRLFTCDGKLWFNGVCCQLNQQGIPEMVVGTIDVNNDDDHINNKNINVLQLGVCRTNLQYPEKNWLFLNFDNNHLIFIYKLANGSFQLARVDIHQWCKKIISVSPCLKVDIYNHGIFKNPLWWRGSAPPVPIPNSNLSIMAAHFTSQARVYWNTLVVLNNNNQICGWSEPFVMQKKQVEFIMSLQFLNNDQLLITWGENDCKSKYFIFSWEKIIKSLKFFFDDENTSISFQSKSLPTTLPTDNTTTTITTNNLLSFSPPPPTIIKEEHSLFDIVIPVGPNDIEILQLCITGIKTHLKNQYENIYIVSNNRVKDRLIGTNQKDNLIWVDENDEKIFPFSNNIESIMKYKYPHFDTGRLGWYKQQLIKLYSPLNIPNIKTNVLICDADVIFNKKIEFINSFKKVINFTNATEYHIPYFDHMNKLLPGLTKQTQYSGVAHHMVMNKYILLDLYEQIEIEHKVPFWVAFLLCINGEHVNGSGASEYEIYFNFVLKNYPHKYNTVERKWINNVSLDKFKKMRNLDPSVEYYACHFHIV
jgi:hypothetical protein